MNDMTSVIEPKATELTADHLLTGPRTIRITEVEINPGTERPVTISFEGDEGLPFKPCKTVSRILVTAWGPDASKYVGRYITLFRDPTVKWGGIAVGGLRPSHLSNISAPLTMALTATKGSKKPFTVKPLAAKQEPTKTPATVADWIAATLVPGLSRCATIEEVAKVQQHKGYVAATERGTDDDRTEMKRLIDAAVSRIDAPAGDPESDPPPADDDDIFPGDA